VLAVGTICSAGLHSAPKRGGLGRVACLLGYMTLRLDRQKTLGLDRAIQTILALGGVLLTAVARECVAFGLFAILQPRYRRM
jgi:hypothetical protein